MKSHASLADQLNALVAQGKLSTTSKPSDADQRMKDNVSPLDVIYCIYCDGVDAEGAEMGRN